MAISRIEKTLQDLPGNKAILGRTSKSRERVHNIAYLLKSFHDQISPILKEKYDIDLELNIENIDDYSKLQGNDFFRSIQNIVENATGAKARKIIINLSSDDGEILVKVSNDGKMIPKEIRDKIFESGFSAGKPNGSGIGLSFVKEKIKSWGGEISLKSDASETSFSLLLKSSPTPSYHHSGIEESRLIVILDDDANIHEKIHKIKGDLKILSFFEEYELLKFLQNPESENYLFFIDYDLGLDHNNGIEIIQENKLGERSVLLTANYDDDELIYKCEKLGVKIMPKNLINYFLES